MPSPIRILSEELLANGWAKVKRVTFDLVRRDGTTARLAREVASFGDGAAVLPYDAERGTVLLARQFRLPAMLAGAGDGMTIEAAAGLLDGDEPEACARRELEEELGYRVTGLKRVLSVLTSPGAVAERLYLFTASYTPADRLTAGGGHAEEGEDIEVLEMPLDQAYAMVGDGRIADAKSVILILHLHAEVRGRRD
ncbi:MAG TPA: NUDIX domain-containing protein [Bauldia sp.]|nr:NUDIX domain-containing protein [Bauldia sp.]